MANKHIEDIKLNDVAATDVVVDVIFVVVSVAIKLIYYCLPVLLKCHSQHLNNKPEQKSCYYCFIYF